MDFYIYGVECDDSVIEKYPVLSKYKYKIKEEDGWRKSYITVETLPELIALVKDIGEDLIVRARSDDENVLTIYDDYIE